MLSRSSCLIKSVSYLFSLIQGGMSWLLDSGQELGIWAFFFALDSQWFFFLMSRCCTVCRMQWQRNQEPSDPAKK